MIKTYTYFLDNFIKSKIKKQKYHVENFWKTTELDNGKTKIKIAFKEEDLNKNPKIVFVESNLFFKEPKGDIVVALSGLKDKDTYETSYIMHIFNKNKKIKTTY